MSRAAAIDIVPGSFGAWVLAARPATLTAAAAPVLVGSACAWQLNSFRALPAAAALAGAFLIQIGTNFANDLYDFKKGADREDRLGPVRVTQHGLLTPAQVRLGLFTSFLLASLAGAYLAFVAGWAIVVIGILSIVAGVTYTAGPYPLGYNGWGDLFVFIFFGFVAVCGTAYVQTGFVPLTAAFASVPIGALTTAILVVNCVRDYKGDRRAGKKTIPVRFGRDAGCAEYTALLVVSYLAPVAFFLSNVASAWIALPLLTAPVAFGAARTLYTTSDGPILNKTLARTAKLLLLYALLLSAGIVLGGR